jgi:hypothetical protein
MPRDAHEGFYREDLSDVDDSAYLEGAQEAETQSKEYGGNQGVDPWAAGKLHNAKDLEINHDEAQNREQHDNPRTEEQRLSQNGSEARRISGQEVGHGERHPGKTHGVRNACNAEAWTRKCGFRDGLPVDGSRAVTGEGRDPNW